MPVYFHNTLRRPGLKLIVVLSGCMRQLDSNARSLTAEYPLSYNTTFPIALSFLVTVIPLHLLTPQAVMRLICHCGSVFTPVWLLEDLFTCFHSCFLFLPFCASLNAHPCQLTAETSLFFVTYVLSIVEDYNRACSKVYMFHTVFYASITFLAPESPVDDRWSFK